MHYSTHALLNCVALLSLLLWEANAGKAPPPSEVLSHFARTVGSVLNPTLIAELQRPNRSVATKESSTPIRRQADTRQISGQNEGVNSGSAERNQGIAVSGVENLQLPGQGFPYQFERSYSYRYPAFNQFSQNFFPGGNAFNNQLLPNGLPGGFPDPRFFQSQFGRNPQLPANQPNGLSKGVNSKLTAASDGAAKDNANNNVVNTLQNIESSTGDSKSSAQNNRPFDNGDFSSIPINPGQGGINLGSDGGNGNLRVDNRYSAIDYERIRQNYYSDPPVNQRYYSSFNEIPFSGGPPYRLPLNDRFSNLDYNGGGGNAGGRFGASSDYNSGNPAGRFGAASDSRGGSGLGNPYYGNFFQGPYQSPNYNNLPGGGGSGAPNNDGAPFSADNFDRGSQNFGSPFGNQYPNGFGGLGNAGNFDGPGGAGNFGGPGVAGNFGGPGGAGNFGGPVGGDGGFGTGDGTSGGIGGPGGDSGFFPGGGFGGGDGDSSLRASSAKQSIARPQQTTESSEENRASIEQLEDQDERIDRKDDNGKNRDSEKKRRSS